MAGFRGTGLDFVTRVKLLAFVVMFTAVVSYFLTREERLKVLSACRDLGRRAAREAMRRWTGQPDDDGEPPAPIAFATWSIAVVTVFVFAGMLFGDGSLADPRTLVSWGASVGPRTTNGEWWRLVTALFVHAGPLHVLATLAGLIQIGCMTERLVGRLAFASVYVASGTLANLVYLSKSPVAVASGGCAAVFAIYGLLLATSVWGALRGAPVRIPWQTAKRLAPGLGFFVLYSVATGRLDRVVAAVALCTGAISGLLFAKGARDHKPALRRVVVLAADSAALIVLFAVPLRGMADVLPEIRHVVDVEDQTARSYDAAVARLTAGAIPPAKLADVIDRAIVPELHAAHARVKELQRVPRQQRNLIAGAEEYFRLREESWRLRTEALRQSRPRLLKEADWAEWRALEALTAIRERGPRAQ